MGSVGNLFDLDRAENDEVTSNVVDAGLSSVHRNRNLIAVIGDEVCVSFLYMTLMLKDTVTGILLAGVGHVDASHKPNFFVVDNSKLV
jgi:hypothetical protein